MLHTSILLYTYRHLTYRLLPCSHSVTLLQAVMLALIGTAACQHAHLNDVNEVVNCRVFFKQYVCIVALVLLHNIVEKDVCRLTGNIAQWLMTQVA